jgi:hypothetical protein
MTQVTASSRRSAETGMVVIFYIPKTRTCRLTSIKISVSAGSLPLPCIPPSTGGAIFSRTMEEIGYCPPHTCKLCQQILVDLSEQPLSTRLKPLHNRIESWPVRARRVVPRRFFGSDELASTLTGQPPLVKPFNVGPIKISRGRLKTVRRLLFWYQTVVWFTSGCPSINKRVTRALSKDPEWVKEAKWVIGTIACYSVSRKQLDRNAASGCLFFQTLANAISASLKGDPPLQDPEFILASERLHSDAMQFGLINYGIRPAHFNVSSLYKADIIFDDGMQDFIRNLLLVYFTMILPNGLYLHLDKGKDDFE